MSAIAWHCTDGHKIASILSEGRLRLEVGPTASRREKRCVWFTTSDTFEPTALPAVMHNGRQRDIESATELAQLTGAVYRIGVDSSRLHSYRTWRAKSGTPAAMQRVMERIAVDRGSNPSADWLVSFNVVKAPAWERIEVSTDGITWQEHPFNRPARGRALAAGFGWEVG